MTWAQSDDLPEAAAQQLETVVVSGIQPGPGLWRVSKGDRVMWVMGTLSPLPKRMEWSADEASVLIAQSQQVLLTPSGKVQADVGFFGGLALIPTAMGARKNPDRRTLEEILTPELYARWEPLRRKYIGRSRSIEKRRPLLAANKLYDKAIKQAGLSRDNVVEKTVKRLAKRADVPIHTPQIEIVLSDTKAALKAFSASDLDDIECFAQTIDRLESDLQHMRERANAWAVGDLQTLSALPFVDQNRSCAQAVLDSAVVRERGLDDLPERLAEVWLQAAETALNTNQRTFAVLPMAQILKPDGYIETLRARGYQVEAPE